MPPRPSDEPFFRSEAWTGIDTAKDLTLPTVEHLATPVPGARSGTVPDTGLTASRAVGMMTAGFALISLAQAVDEDSDPYDRVKGILDVAELALTASAGQLQSLSLAAGLDGGSGIAALAGGVATAGIAVGGASTVMTLFAIMGIPYAQATARMEESGAAAGERLGISAAVLGMHLADFRNDVLGPYLPASIGDDREQAFRHALTDSAMDAFHQVRLLPPPAVEAYRGCLFDDLADRRVVAHGYHDLVLTVAGAVGRAHTVCLEAAQTVMDEVAVGTGADDALPLATWVESVAGRGADPDGPDGGADVAVFGGPSGPGDRHPGRIDDLGFDPSLADDPGPDPAWAADPGPDPAWAADPGEAYGMSVVDTGDLGPDTAGDARDRTRSGPDGFDVDQQFDPSRGPESPDGTSAAGSAGTTHDVSTTGDRDDQVDVPVTAPPAGRDVSVDVQPEHVYQAPSPPQRF